jgi:hypothetical protein
MPPLAYMESVATKHGLLSPDVRLWFYQHRDNQKLIECGVILLQLRRLAERRKWHEKPAQNGSGSAASATLLPAASVRSG